MRYVQMGAFRKHLIETKGIQTNRLYLIAIPDPAEREEALREVISHWPTGSLHRATNLVQLFDLLDAPLLFGDEPHIVMDGADKWSKRDLERFIERLTFPLTYGYIALLASGKGSLSSVFSAVERQGVILDLTEEKPWDRERRIGEWLVERALRGGKRIDSQAATFMLQEGERDLALLERELEKLIAYVGDRPSIEREDVEQIATLHRSATHWQLAEDLVWERTLREMPESALITPFITAVRTQLEMGAKLVALSGTSLEAIRPHFPKVWPKTLERRKGMAVALGAQYFEKGLKALYQVELWSRSSPSSVEALVTLLRGKLYAALPSSQRSS